jgi:hypothetical protein
VDGVLPRSVRVVCLSPSGSKPSLHAVHAVDPDATPKETLPLRWSDTPVGPGRDAGWVQAQGVGQLFSRNQPPGFELDRLRGRKVAQAGSDWDLLF